MKSIKLRFLIISIICTIIAWFVYSLALMEIVDWIFRKYQRLFLIRITIIDIFIIGFIPYWVYLAYRSLQRRARFFIILTTTIFSLIIAIFLGGLIAILVDVDSGSPLLPKYPVYEVFPFYWTVINSVGILIGILPYKPWRKTQNIVVTEYNKESELQNPK